MTKGWPGPDAVDAAKLDRRVPMSLARDDRLPPPRQSPCTDHHIGQCRRRRRRQSEDHGQQGDKDHADLLKSEPATVDPGGRPGKKISQASVEG
jgi:hypothetical protein